MMLIRAHYILPNDVICCDESTEWEHILICSWEHSTSHFRMCSHCVLSSERMRSTSLDGRAQQMQCAHQSTLHLTLLTLLTLECALIRAHENMLALCALIRAYQNVFSLGALIRAYQNVFSLCALIRAYQNVFSLCALIRAYQNVFSLCALIRAY